MKLDNSSKKAKSTIAEEFDEFADNYTQDMLRFVPYYAKQLSSVIDYIPSGLQPKKILDIGCGNGNVTALLLKTFPEAEYTLVDASPEMLNLCQNRFPDIDFKIYQGYFQDLKLEDNKYDIATAVLSIHHLKATEKQQFFSMVNKFLKPGGLFLTSDLMIDKENKDHPRLLTEWKDFMYGNGSTDEEWNWMMDHYEKFDSPSDWQKQVRWLEDEGFSVYIPWRAGYWTHIQAVKNN